MIVFAVQVDSYWTYELCHGKHLRQFHEVRGKNGQVGFVDRCVVVDAPEPISMPCQPNDSQFD